MSERADQRMSDTIVERMSDTIVERMSDTIVERRTSRWWPGRALRRSPAALCVAGLVLAACGDTGAPAIDPQGAPDEGALAPVCREVDRMEAVLPDDTEPTGTTAEPGDDDVAGAPEMLTLAPEVEAWAQQDAADSFAGVWVDQDLGGYAVAFASDVDRYAAEVRERFHPGLAVAEADHSYAELRDIQDRVGQEQMGRADREPGAVTSVGVDVMSNRTTVGVFDPDDQRLAELSDIYGATAICLEVEDAPQPPGDEIVTLAKASGWRDGLESELGSPFAVLEVADDRDTAEAAWRDNVPDDLDPRDEELPAEPGVYGDLDQVDLDRQAVVVWSSGESGSCPGWLTDVDHGDGVIRVERGATGEICDDDYNPFRLVLAIDRDRLPHPDELASARLEGVPDGEVRTYPTEQQ